ncbi:MAG: FkbM family methyltransferase [bacterium]
MVNNDIHNAPTFILYGAGNTGRDVMALLRRKGKDVAFFLDAKAQPGMQVEGCPVYAPASIPPGKRQPELPVIVCIFNRDVDVLVIVEMLRAQGWRSVITFIEFHARHADSLGDRFWLSSPDVYERDSDRIAAVGQLWADEKSRIIYRDMLSSRRSGRLDGMPCPGSGEVQYFPSDVEGWLEDLPLRFVDCGAYDGDTLRAVAALGIHVEGYAAFEPDMDNFRRLCEAGKNLLEPGTRMHLWPCGVSSHAELVTFACGLGESSHVATGGVGASIPCVGLDEVLRGFRPNMIKMDIEGAEPQALTGAKELLVENRPRLAISIYHCPDHLWTIPLAVAGLKCDYNFYLRVHGYNLFDVVLYAVPR